MYQYIPYLKKAGIEVSVAPFLDDTYLSTLYAGKRQSRSALAGYYLRRISCLLESGSFDLVWIEKELFPFLPAWGEKLLHLFKKKYLVDYDDAIFHNYDLHGNWAVRFFLSKKIDAVMKHASLVIAGNEYLAARALQSGAGRIEYLPTVIDLERYRVSAKHSTRPFTVGWIGSPSTGKYLRGLKSVFDDFCRSGASRIILIGISDSGLDGIPVEYRTWSENTELDSLSDCDVGIMPLFDSPWEQGKCGYKLIQYMACGLPVIASPIGINRNIVDHGTTGFLADTPEEWLSALTALRDNPALRKRMGEEGRHRVEERYCLQVTAPRLAELMMSLCGEHREFTSPIVHGSREKKP
jgi:glycosyltransferase involved in cell wall biosynthesis